MSVTLRVARIVMNLWPEELGAIAKKVLGIKRGIYRVGDFLLWLDPASNLGYQLLSSGEVEEKTKETIERLLHPGGIFIDVGANEGWFSLQAARRVGPSGCVYCVEPQERLWPVIIKNFSLNNMIQYRILPYAIGERKETTILNLSLSLNSGSTSIIPLSRYRLRKKQMLHTMPLDNLIDLYSIKKIDLLKLDVEGYELFALRGMQKLLKSGRIRHFIVEYHPQQLGKIGQTKDEIVRYIEKFKYKSSDGRLWHVHNKK